MPEELIEPIDGVATQLSQSNTTDHLIAENNNKNNTGDTVSNVIVENWIFAPIAVTIQKMNVSKSNNVFNIVEKETKRQFLLEALIPFLFAGLGLILAGVMLESAEGSEFFTVLPDAVIMVPTLVGLKGNLEMTLSSRLSTLANLGFMETKRDKVNVALSNLALIQCQAIAVSSLAVIPVLFIGEQTISFDDTLCLLLSAVVTASLASLVLSLLMVAVVIAARRWKLNPDNISTPVAASLGDVSTLYILLSVGTLICHMRDLHITFLIVILLFFYAIAIIGAVLAAEDRFTLEVLKNGWWPILCAMLITTFSGLILKKSMQAYPPLAAFQPLINGLGGNLVAVQASRISTQLHRARKNREVEVRALHHYINPIRAFFGKNEDASAAKILLGISIPSNILFIFIIFLIGVGFHNTVPFTISFVLVCAVQVTILLYICQFLVRTMWVMRIDPDNSAIPFLTALGDLIGSLLLILCFWSQWKYFDLPVSADQYTGHKFGH
uniref:SLC41A/MgtE integral membrane domain-containing protein n=1 Tax=Caenorhabditis japonica TaxID=281687 RepID=A0A8R1HS40_CAEJA